MPELNQNIPRHIAIIMDGNGRWATKRGKLRVVGHRAGLRAVRKVVNSALQQGVSVLTLYAFSSENWNRPIPEVAALMSLFIHALNREIGSLHKRNIKLHVIGDTSRFDSKLQKMIEKSQLLTMHNSRLILNIAANYGGRWDIIQATKRLISLTEQKQLSVNEIDETLFTQQLSLAGLPEIDLVIRTGGECRISNFLLWQVAYAELYFTDTLWPDFDELQFMQAIHSFQSRGRRFGGANPLFSEITSC